MIRIVMKKLLLFLLVSMQLLMTASPVFAAEMAESGNSKILFKYTCDDGGDSKFVNTLGRVTTEESDDAEHGKVLRLDASTGSTASVYVNIDSKEPIKTGYVVMSWDFKTDNISTMSYVRSFTDYISIMSESVVDKMFETIMYQSTKVSLINGLKGFTKDTQGATIPRMEWQHNDVWFDFITRRVKLYVDGRFITEQPMPESFTQYCGYVFNATADQGNANNVLDNLYIGHVPTGGEKVDFDFVQGIPSEVEDPFSVELSIANVGHMFTEPKVEADVVVMNPYNHKQELNYKRKIICNNGEVECEKEEMISLEPYEIKTLKLSEPVKNYGYHTIYVDISDPKTGKVIGAQTRCSVMRAREDGRLNDQVGLNSHYITGKGLEKMDELQDLFAKTGISFMREGVTWAHYESTKDQYGLYDTHIRYFDALNRNKQGNLFVLGHESLARNIRYPKTEEERGYFNKYVENLVKDLKPYGFKRFGVWNEVNYYWQEDWHNLITIDEYVYLLHDTYQTIHSIIPDAKVYAFEMGGYHPDFMELVFQGIVDKGWSLRDCFDGISYHTYPLEDKPEESKYMPNLNAMKDIMEKWGIGDMPLSVNETGYSSDPNYGITPLNQAQYSVRLADLSRYNCENMQFYVNINKIDNTNVKEYNFGWLQGWRDQEINYEAKPVMIAMANYNYFMSGATDNGRIEVCDGKGFVHKHVNDGKDVYMAWTIRNDEELSLNIGADYAEIYDMYGTKRIQKTVDGVLNLNINESMQYIVGNFTNCEEVKNKGFSTNSAEVTSIRNDNCKIEVTNKMGNDEDYKVELGLPEGASVSSQTGFINGVDNITVALGGKVFTDNVIKVTVKNKTGDMVYYKEIKLTINKSSDVEFLVEYDKSARWKGILRIFNNRNDGDVNGQLIVEAPEELKKYRPVIELENLSSKTGRLYEFPIPVDLTRDFMEFKGRVVLNNGEVYEINESSYFAGLAPIRKQPKIDGSIEPGEYNSELPFRFNKTRMLQVPNTKVGVWNWEGLNDLSATGYINYDSKYLYLAYEVTDDILGDNDAQGRIWANDSIQFAFADKKTTDGAITEIGIGLVNGKPEIARYSYMGEKENIYFHEAVGAKEGFEEDTELAIIRKGNKTIYELKLAWVDIYPTTQPFDQKFVLFSTIINENDATEEGREGWLEFSPGIGTEKYASLFTKIPVAK